MKLLARPIITVGSMVEGEFRAIPFMAVVILSDDKTPSSVVFANYTFRGGNAVDWKLRQLESIQTGGETHKYELMENTVESLAEAMRGILERAVNRSKILFVIDKAVGDDTPWYRAMGINKKERSTILPPTTIGAFGYSLTAPFFETDLETLVSNYEVRRL